MGTSTVLDLVIRVPQTGRGKRTGIRKSQWLLICKVSLRGSKVSHHRTSSDAPQSNATDEPVTRSNGQISCYMKICLPTCSYDPVCHKLTHLFQKGTKGENEHNTLVTGFTAALNPWSTI